jgi:hypothetical protein
LVLGGGDLERFGFAVPFDDDFILLADGQFRHHLVQERDFLRVAHEDIFARDS